MNNSNRKARVKHSAKKPIVEREIAKWIKLFAQRGVYPPQINILFR